MVDIHLLGVKFGPCNFFLYDKACLLFISNSEFLSVSNDISYLLALLNMIMNFSI